MRGGERALHVLGQGLGGQGGERRRRAAGRREVGGVGLHQDLRLVAARHAPGEVAGDGHGEQHVAPADHGVELGGRAGLGHEVEEIAALQGADHRAGEDAVLLHQHGGGQVTRLGVDGEAEQQELDHGQG
ncbi:hypothetical protein LRS04_01285 [Phenylobacterium sp. J367]|nr:hypothetical protein [Phenylobacterium sp. J367]MCR5877156.1 hypothetical protein [Phenylobacterium sp. J367]